MNGLSVPLTSIESSPDLSTDNSVQNNSDGSFQPLLEEAKKKLGSFGLIPWAQLGSMFDLPSFDFDPQIDITETETQLSDKKHSSPEKVENSIAPAIQKTETAKDAADVLFSTKNTQAIKQTLSQNIPLPYLVGVPNLLGNTLAGAEVSRPNLQLVIDELIEKANFLKTSNRSELSLLISEKSLGEMIISLINRQGALSIEISAKAETRKLINDNLRELEVALEKAHLNISDIKVVEVKKDDDRS